MPCGVPLSKNTDFDAHRWVFSRILYSCSAAYRLVFDAPPAQWIGTDFSQAEGALRCEKSVEICEICGQQLSAQCAKEQAECFYSPTDRADKHRYHAGCFYQKTRDPEASAVGGAPRRLALASHPPPLARLIGVNEGVTTIPPARRGRQCSCSLSCGLR